WLLSRGSPSTRTEPFPIRRSAAAREPISGRAERTRSSRSPASASETRKRSGANAWARPVGRDEREEEQGDTDDDEAVGEVERGPPAKVDEVGHVPQAHPVGEV